MKDLKTLKAIVKDGKIILDLPDYIDGTQLELKIISSEKSLQEQISDQFGQDTESHYNPDDIADSGTLIDKNKLFHELNLIAPLLEAVEEQGYRHPSPIQVKAIPLALEGRDVLGTAQTGSGKTAAFSLPIIQLLAANKPRGKPYPRALILSPTRELASQIGESIDTYGEYTEIRQVTIYGGVSQKPQERELKKGKDVLVATPGRLLDLIGQGIIDLDRIEIFVLDEADRMLDMGFIHDIRKVIKLIPDKRQTMLFSATMPKQIIDLANKMLINPEHISVDPPSSPVETIASSVFFVEKPDKFKLLAHLLKSEKISKALVFMRTKHSANNTAKKLSRRNIVADSIHGNKSQNGRERALRGFKKGDISVLVATDIAARGIDINDITHIINYDMSNEAEVYVHRIGRTARAGKSGIAYNFCDEKERSYLVDVERLIQDHLMRAEDYPFMSNIQAPDMTDLNPSRRRSRPKRRKQRRQNYK